MRAYDVIWTGIVPSDGQNTTDGAEGLDAIWCAQACATLRYRGRVQRRGFVRMSRTAAEHSTATFPKGT